MSILIQLGIIY